MNKFIVQTSILLVTLLSPMASFGMDRAIQLVGNKNSKADIKLLEHPCFKGESLLVQSELFKNDRYKQLPEYVSAAIDAIGKGSFTDADHERAVTLYHATLRPVALDILCKQIDIVESIKKMCADEDKKLTELKAYLRALKNVQVHDNEIDLPRLRRLTRNKITSQWDICYSTLLCGRIEEEKFCQMYETFECFDYPLVIEMDQED